MRIKKFNSFIKEGYKNIEVYDPVKIISKGDFLNLKGNVVDIRTTESKDKNAGSKDALVDLAANGMIVINELKEKGHHFQNPFSRVPRQNFRTNKGSIGINETCVWFNENSLVYNKK